MTILYGGQRSSVAPVFRFAHLNICAVTLYGLVIAVTCFGLGRAHAQANNSDQDHFSYGLNPASEEQLRGIPVTPTYRDFLPPKKDLANLFPAVGDQGRQNSCVGWAVGYAARAYYAHYAEDRDVSRPENIPSPAYVYNLIKQPGACDTGSTIPDALNLLKLGAQSLKQFPYRQNVCLPPASNLQASDFRIDSWSQVNFKVIDQIKAALYHGDPVIVGFHVSSAFEHLKGSQIYRNPDRYLGWHAITIVGYDDTRQAFKLINSWSTAWADHGYGWVDYLVITAEVHEAYVMHVSGFAPQPIPPPVAVVPPPPPQPKPAPAPTPAKVVPPPLPVPEPKPAPVPSPVEVVPPPPVPQPKPVPVPTPAEVVPPPPTPQPKPAPVPTPVEVVPPKPHPQPVPIVLPQLECAEVRMINSDHRQTIAGFIGHDEDLERIRAAAEGAEIDVKVRPFPQCEALITLDKPLGRPASELPKVKIRQLANNILTEGDDLV